MTSKTAKTKSAWSPLAITVFRSLWIANLVSNIGGWMHEVGAALLMTSLTPSPLVVALITTATSLPLFVASLPAGAIGDLVDKRKFLIVAELWMVVCATALGVLTIADAMTPTLLLVLTFALGIGQAMHVPVWQSAVPQLVPKDDLPNAIALNGISLNISRAIGPAVGGLLVAATSPATVFFVNAVSFLVVTWALFRWRSPAQVRTLPPERLGEAMTAGLRYTRHAPEFRAVLVRIATFMVCGSAVWALLPVIARQELGFGALGYGLLLGAIGAGAVAMAALLPRVRAALAADQLTVAAVIVFAGVAVILAFVRVSVVLFPAMFVGGMAWICIMATFNTAAQQSSALWVRARALAVYAIAFQGAMAAGSALWGVLASEWSVEAALAAAAAGMVGSSALALRYRVGGHEDRDLGPSRHWPTPVLAADPSALHDGGPVVVRVEYRVAAENREAFLDSVQALEGPRRRDGAVSWRVYQDPADPMVFTEEFEVASWIQHLRQHERFTNADRELEAKIRKWQVADAPVRITHSHANGNGNDTV